MSEVNIEVEYDFTEDEYSKMFAFLQKYADQIAYDVNERLARECYKAAKKITHDAIAAFYGAYSPHLYKRKGGLYDIFDIQVSGDDFIFAVDDDLMGWHRSNEAVLELDFMQGYHGGSRWRTPPRPGVNVNAVTDEGEPFTAFATHPWQFWHPTQAAQSYPPNESIKMRWSAFLKGRYQQLKKQIIKQVASEYAVLM